MLEPVTEWSNWGVRKLVFHHTSYVFLTVFMVQPVKIKVGRGNSDVANHWMKLQDDFLLSKKSMGIHPCGV